MTDTGITPTSAPAKESTEIELIPIDSLTSRVVGQWTGLMVEGAAFLMQGMHPVIAEVVGKYSIVLTDPKGRGVRSFDSVLRWVYGGQEAIVEGQRLRELHAPLQMTSKRTGRRISALHKESYQWVIATAYITTSQAGPLLIGREFTIAEKDELLRDNRRLARILQVPMKDYPATRAEFDAYSEHMIANVLEPTAEARALVALTRDGQDFSGQPAGRRTRLQRGVAETASAPLRRLSYLAMMGLLDPRLRDALGIEWSRRDQLELDLYFKGIRLAHRALPERLTYHPLAYHARRHHAVILQMKERERESAAYKVPLVATDSSVGTS